MDEFSVDVPMSRRRHHGDAAARRWALARTWALGLALAIACQSALAQAMYRIKPLGYLGGCISSVPTVVGLNGADEVTGYACNANGDNHAFLWRNNGTPMVDLGPPEVGSMSYGNALNASGLVAGAAKDSTGSFGFVSSGDGAPMTRIYDGIGGASVTAAPINDLGQVTGTATTTSGTHAFLKSDGSPMRDLGTLGGSNSFADSINSSGQVAGRSDLPGNTGRDLFVWKNDGTPMIALGAPGAKICSCIAINASGQVAFGSTRSASQRAAWRVFFGRNDGTPIQDVGTLGGAGSFFGALNDSGQIAGSSVKKNGDTHAFLWNNDGAPMVDLGTLGGTDSGAADINNSGQVTGAANPPGDTVTHAFLWRNDGTKIQDLNALIDPTDSLKSYVTLTSGDFINDLGDILAEGTDSRTGVSAPYLLQGTVLTLASRSLAFGNQRVNTTSAAKSVTLTNTSAKVVAITSIALTGTSAGQFAQTNNCGKSLAGHATCTIKVTFKPTTKGAKSEVLNVNGGGGGLRSVALTGTGT
jgi:probable HAF family extracellular repeat protein